MESLLRLVVMRFFAWPASHLKDSGGGKKNSLSVINPQALATSNQLRHVYFLANWWNTQNWKKKLFSHPTQEDNNLSFISLTMCYHIKDLYIQLLPNRRHGPDPQNHRWHPIDWIIYDLLGSKSAMNSNHIPLNWTSLALQRSARSFPPGWTLQQGGEIRTPLRTKPQPTTKNECAVVIFCSGCDASLEWQITQSPQHRPLWMQK